MTFAIAMPTTGGSLENYIRSANSFPILSQEEEVSLARRLRDEEDLNAARQLGIISFTRSCFDRTWLQRLWPATSRFDSGRKYWANESC